MGTANRKPPFGVPTIIVGTIVPTNLSEQPIGNQFSVLTILYIKPSYSRPPPLTHWFSIGTLSSLFRQICGNSCSHKLFWQALWEQALFPQICRNRVLSLIPLPVEISNPSLPLKSYLKVNAKMSKMTTLQPYHTAFSSHNQQIMQSTGQTASRQ